MTTLDTPTKGFVPPAQLRKSRPSLVANRMGTTDSAQAGPRPQHTRTASLFSFTSKKSAQQQAQRATIQASPTHQRSPTSTSGHVSVSRRYLASVIISRL